MLLSLLCQIHLKIPRRRLWRRIPVSCGSRKKELLCGWPDAVGWEHIDIFASSWLTLETKQTSKVEFRRYWRICPKEIEHLSSIKKRMRVSWTLPMINFSSIRLHHPRVSNTPKGMCWPNWVLGTLFPSISQAVDATSLGSRTGMNRLLTNVKRLLGSGLYDRHGNPSLFLTFQKA